MQGLVRFFISLPLAALYGWILSYFWLWFLSPMGAPAINLWQAWGLFLTANFVRLWFTSSDSLRDYPEDKKKEREIKAWGLLVFKPVIALLMLGVASLVQMGVA